MHSSPGIGLVQVVAVAPWQNVACRRRIKEEDKLTLDLATITAHFALPEPRRVERLTLGTMNHNWRVDTARGSFAVKRIIDVDAEQTMRSHNVMTTLAQRGLPVPQPISTKSGQTILHHDGELYAVLTWMAGDFRPTSQLVDGDAETIGRLLAATHRALADLLVEDDVAIDGMPDAAGTLSKIDTLLELIGDRDEPFDIEAKRLLHNRIQLIERFADQRPSDLADLGPASCVHGDFQLFNVLWRDREVTGLVDWDRVRVRPRSVELVRAAQLIFDCDMHRISRFVHTYQELNPLPSSAILAALEQRWWHELCALWMLNRHYRNGETSCDHLMPSTEARLIWWCDHRDEVATAFT